ncbi:unnamed protein product [Alopecurus aequalis]
MPRRSGVNPIAKGKNRDITFYKRRSGLFKGAADLSVLTGARVAVILEAERGKIHSFGTPSAKIIVDAFLSGTTPSVDEAKTSNIARLQSELARLEEDSMKLDKRNQISIQHMKKIQDDNPGMAANLLFSKEEDLSLEDLYKLFNELSRVKEDIQSRLPPLHHGQVANIGIQNMTRNMLPSTGLSCDHLQTTPSLLQSSWSHHPPQHQLLSGPLLAPPEQTSVPLLPMKVAQILHTTPVDLAPQLTSLLKSIPDQIQDQLPPQDIVLPNYPSTCNTVQPPQNYAGPEITFKHNLEDSAPLLVNSGVNDCAIEGIFGNDPWGYPLSDNLCHNEILGMNSYLGYNGTNEGLLGNDPWFNAPPEYSSRVQDADNNAQYGGLP